MRTDWEHPLCKGLINTAEFLVSKYPENTEVQRVDKHSNVVNTAQKKWSAEVPSSYCHCPIYMRLFVQLVYQHAGLELDVIDSSIIQSAEAALLQWNHAGIEDGMSLPGLERFSISGI